MFQDGAEARRAEPKVRPAIIERLREADIPLDPKDDPEAEAHPLKAFETLVRKNVLVVGIVRPIIQEQRQAINDCLA